MSGIFAVSCPTCGSEAAGVDAEHWVCHRCNQAYLVGVGYMVPVTWADATAGRPAATTPVGTEVPDDHSPAGA